MEISLVHAEKSKLGIREIMRCESEIHNSRTAKYARRADNKHWEALQRLAELLPKVGAKLNQNCDSHALDLAHTVISHIIYIC